MNAAQKFELNFQIKTFYVLWELGGDNTQNIILQAWGKFANKNICFQEEDRIIHWT